MAEPLLRRQRFLPLFLTQALGALNDNLFKNALVVLVIFRLPGGGASLVALAGGIFILPYALFSSVAGQWADGHDKARLIRIVKLCEVALSALAAVGFLAGSIPLLLAVLFGLGVHSTVFGPLKYGILPDHLGAAELLRGNALIEAGTFVSILLGTILGGALIATPDGPALAAGGCCAVALAGLAAAWFIPAAPAACPGLQPGWNIFRETTALLRHARDNRSVWLSLLGLSWFWTVGATFLAEFPVIVTRNFAADAPVVTLLLTCFTLGIGAGSLLAGRLLRGEVSARHVLFAVLLLSLFGLDFAHVVAGVGPQDGWTGVAAMLSHPLAWRALADLLLVAVCGGVFSVPLYAIIQARAQPASRSRMLAANNVMNALFMVAGALVAAALLALGVTAASILTLTALLNLVAAGVSCRLLPQDVLRVLFRLVFRTLWRVRVSGLEHYRSAGDRVVLVANHVSLADGALIAAFVPDTPVFAVNADITRRWWARPFLAPVEVLEVDPTHAFAAREMVRVVKAGRRLVIFPEGRITRTGALMKTYDGAGMVMDHAGAVALPVRIDGPQFTPLSHMQGKWRLRWFPKVSLTFLPPVALDIDPSLQGRARRQALGTALHDVLADARLQTGDTARSLFVALLDAADRFGRRLPAAEDLSRTPLSYGRLILGAAVLGRALALRTTSGEVVGVLLPNAVGALVTFFALQAFGRVPAMLNVSAGAEGMISACTVAGVRTVLCSRAFVERAKLEDTVAAMAQHVAFVWLEEVRATLGLREKLRGVVDGRRARHLPGAVVAPDAAAVVLFTSGSEGVPKAVALSHRNILANCAQVACVVDFTPADRVLNAMPMFHSFGLTGGTLVPLLHGVPNFLYPSPLHYRIVPEAIYDFGATITFGSDTFLSGWARYAHPYDFYAMRYIFAGAERLREETRRLYAERFGVRVMEGYGVTETAPVIAVNTPLFHAAGTVGRLLPGMAWRIEPVAGITGGGKLLVRGPNVMLGYLRPGLTAPEAPEGGWYDTGDIVSRDAMGFVRIVGRVKRFAKIGGEMISMVAAEALAGALWPEAMHGVIAVADPRKGEALLLLTTQADASARALLDHAHGRGMAEIGVPRAVQVIREMPLLGTGKIDYPALQRVVEGQARVEAA